MLFKRGNVIWIDFGFNIGNEFGGMHPAVILKNFEYDLFVIPISSKKPPEYIKLDQDLENQTISEEEYNDRKDTITEIIELSKINGFRNMLRWARITRMKKISMLRINYSGTIGTLEGKDMDKIAEKISIELGNSQT
ncbi:MAG: type II toxin-antitoxin system PemK/MazF family toxin [Clostridia bacterium]|nr:type II toxin-antitoxin system PemK/MazF family toxin [Clostridia bacterium]